MNNGVDYKECWKRLRKYVEWQRETASSEYDAGTEKAKARKLTCQNILLYMDIYESENTK